MTPSEYVAAQAFSPLYSSTRMVEPLSTEDDFSYELTAYGHTTRWRVQHHLHTSPPFWSETMVGDTEPLATAPSLEELARAVLEIGD